MRTLTGALYGLALGGLTLIGPPAAAQDNSSGMPQQQSPGGAPSSLLPGGYTSLQAPPARGSETPTVPGGDNTAALPVNAETAGPDTATPVPGNGPGNGMMLGGSDASAALPEMQVPQRPGEGKGTLQ